MQMTIPLGTSRRSPLLSMVSTAAPSGWQLLSDSQRSPHGCAAQTLSKPATTPLDLHEYDGNDDDDDGQ
jgi:hypothetical protein